MLNQRKKSLLKFPSMKNATVIRFRSMNVILTLNIVPSLPHFSAEWACDWLVNSVNLEGLGSSSLSVATH